MIEALETSIEETDTETISSERQQEFSSERQQRRILRTTLKQKVELKKEYFSIIDLILSSMDCRYWQSDLRCLGILEKVIINAANCKDAGDYVQNATFRNISSVGHLRMN